MDSDIEADSVTGTHFRRLNTRRWLKRPLSARRRGMQRSLSALSDVSAAAGGGLCGVRPRPHLSKGVEEDAVACFHHHAEIMVQRSESLSPGIARAGRGLTPSLRRRTVSDPNMRLAPGIAEQRASPSALFGAGIGAELKTPPARAPRRDMRMKRTMSGMIQRNKQPPSLRTITDTDDTGDDHSAEKAPGELRRIARETKPRVPEPPLTPLSMNTKTRFQGLGALGRSGGGRAAVMLGIKDLNAALMDLGECSARRHGTAVPTQSCAGFSPLRCVCRATGCPTRAAEPGHAWCTPRAATRSLSPCMGALVEACPDALVRSAAQVSSQRATSSSACTSRWRRRAKPQSSSAWMSRSSSTWSRCPLSWPPAPAHHPCRPLCARAQLTVQCCSGWRLQPSLCQCHAPWQRQQLSDRARTPEGTGVASRETEQRCMRALLGAHAGRAGGRADR